MEELLSVIMPVYNGEKYIRQTLRSVLSQNYHNIELIVVNDGSTDNTENILKEAASNDSRVKVLHTDRQKMGGGIACEKSCIKRGTRQLYSLFGCG